MARRTLEERVSAIEVQLAGKTLEEHFRVQAELIDERFAARDVRLGRLERDVSDLKADVRSLKIDMGVVKADVAILKSDVGMLKADVGTLKKEMVIVREGITILLKRSADGGA